VKIREETVQLVHETVCIPVGKIAKKAVWSAFLLIQHSKYSAMYYIISLITRSLFNRIIINTFYFVTIIIRTRLWR